MIKWTDAVEMIWLYAKKRFTTQVKAVSFIVLYLLIFQTTILNLPIIDLTKIIGGIFLVTLGLTFFMEGLVLGIMPIGESLGVKLPGKVALFGILMFAFILGIGATLAEPAIGILRAMGMGVEQDRAPLLYFILNHKPTELIMSVGLGVGLAVVLGVLRFLYNWSLKPLIYPLVLICLGLSTYSLFDQDFAHILGLAWDCGAVTTGPVTVPLVIALGLGISRVVTGHTEEGTSSGFGVVTLASLLPIISVLILGLVYQKSYDYKNFSHAETKIEKTETSQNNQVQMITDNIMTAAQAILPLCLFMLIVFRFLLKEKFLHLDEIILGIVLSLVGMSIFNIGIEAGLGKLGKQVGGFLPSAYTSIQLKEDSKIIHNFDPKSVQIRYSVNGEKEVFFYLVKDKKITTVTYDENNYDANNKTYRYTPVHGPQWGENKYNLIGILIVLGFGFLMGYGATLAEPALNTLGATVEDISVGTFRKNLLIQTVAIGVGFGIMIGVTKIIWNVPIYWMLTIPYLVLLILSHFSSEDFVNIAWDSAGVTTGPVTVPLVLAMGLGIGNQSGAIEGFGILAMASVCPIMSVLIMGLIVDHKRKSILIQEDMTNAESIDA